MRLKWNTVLFDELTAQCVKRSVTDRLQNKDGLRFMNSSATLVPQIGETCQAGGTIQPKINYQLNYIIFRLTFYKQYHSLHLKNHIELLVHIYDVYRAIQYHSRVDFRCRWSTLSMYHISMLFGTISGFLLGRQESTGLNWLLNTAEAQVFWISV